MYILDTDHLSILQRENSIKREILRENLREYDILENVTTTIISFQENVQGWLAFLNKPRVDIVGAYRKLDTVRFSFCKMEILPFSAEANEILLELREQKVRIGTMDLRIASIVMANDATLLTCNLRDFKQVPNLKVQDWTQP